jgi:hypothetical protein
MFLDLCIAKNKWKFPYLTTNRKCFIQNAERKKIFLSFYLYDMTLFFIKASQVRTFSY